MPLTTCTLLRLDPLLQVADKGASLLEQVQLTPAAKKRSASYSGGMKRRLSVALALLGNPQLVFLDEPSTGVGGVHYRISVAAKAVCSSHPIYSALYSRVSVDLV